MANRDRKDSKQPVASEHKRPKSTLDERFLSLAEYVMEAHGIKSPSALSKELGKGVDFLSKIRRGLQSAPPDAWDTLLSKYPEARNMTTNVMSQGGGQAVGTVHGDNHYSPTTLEACQLELEQHKRDLAGSRAEVERLMAQLASKEEVIGAKDALIAAQAESLSLLRGGHNQPN